jgi:hypothetical protein
VAVAVGGRVAVCVGGGVGEAGRVARAGRVAVVKALTSVAVAGAVAASVVTPAVGVTSTGALWQPIPTPINKSAIAR